ncbi:uncharacterized protein LOC105840598 [Monomorium pharaonis]|uniref:uncharacterized protein LOC105840598 n=1 Tax=Monomorium pharaonis TaxID=307658 RepID=UPI00063F1524|nr:uncharacterized protein LOC105840598 [Monomorium pharaonis]
MKIAKKRVPKSAAVSIQGINPGFNYAAALRKGEVLEKLAETSSCSKNEIKLGNPSKTFRGLHSVWAQCPIEAAIRAADKSKLVIGWTVAKVKILRRRPVRCFKCWEIEHLQAHCKANVDRSGACFNCGSAGHRAATCSLPAKCMVCQDKEEDPNHKIGTVNCVNNIDPNKVEAARRTASTAAVNG